MASITIRRLDDRLKRRLRVRAAENGRSMEEEARVILRVALDREPAAPVTNLGTAIHDLFRPFGGVELDIPPREPMREPPRFDSALRRWWSSIARSRDAVVATRNVAHFHGTEVEVIDPWQTA